MNNKELIRRALLGDKQAQQECTERGIALPCPCCGRPEQAIINGSAVYHVYADCSMGERFVSLHKWNARPAPPIGRCGECKYYKPEQKSGACLPAECDSPHSTLFPVKPDTFCSYFKPREEK